MKANVATETRKEMEVLELIHMKDEREIVKVMDRNIAVLKEI